IIQDYKVREGSELHMGKEDWLQLIAETDRCWNHITLRLCADYTLSQEEIYLCCLYLTDLPVSYFGCLLDCKRDTIHKKANRIVEKQMGFPHGSTSLQKVLKERYTKTI
ncbi:conserved domain protein, partial [Bacteroides fluxus YIT 12057]